MSSVSIVDEMFPGKVKTTDEKVQELFASSPTLSKVTPPTVAQVEEAAANYMADKQMEDFTATLKDIISAYGALEDSSAKDAYWRTKTLMKDAQDFNSAEAELNRLFQQSSADKSMEFTAEQARLDREFQQSSADKAMQFSADQAQLNRDWQERLSNTAYQRAVNDMRAAGLNPILAYSKGGAAVTSGSSASGVSASGSRAAGSSASGSAASSSAPAAVKSNIASVVGSVLSSNASLISTMLGNQSKEKIAKANRDLEYTIAGMHSAVNLLDTILPW